MARYKAALAALALAVLATAFSRAQDNPDALRLYVDGRYDEARRACLSEIASSPANVDSYIVLSWSLLALKRYADAENYALKGYAIRRDSRLTETLGETAYFLGRNDAALRNFQNYVSAVSEGGRVGFAYYYMGEIYLRLGRFGHADIAFSTALQYTSGSAKWWTRLGYAREKYGDAVHALEAYKKALSIDPRLQDASDGSERVSAKLR
ncbi:MAG: tetratricopeptide repeat protein [Rectinemataceae bacterium]|jgi:tetratricopeptide (TPR) repeat protein